MELEAAKQRRKKEKKIKKQERDVKGTLLGERERERGSSMPGWTQTEAAQTECMGKQRGRARVPEGEGPRPKKGLGKGLGKGLSR